MMRAPRLAVAFMCALLPCVVCGLIYLTDHYDGAERASEEKLVRYGVSGWVSDSEAEVVGQADWDDAMQNLGVHFDRGWAHTFIGQFLYEVGGIERAFVVDGHDHAVYAAVRGVDRPIAEFERLAGPVGDLLARLRGEEVRLHHRPDFGRTLAKPVRTSSLKLVDGHVYLVTATLVQSDFGQVKMPGNAPVVLSLAAMDESFLRSLADHVLVDDVTVRAGPACNGPPGIGCVQLFNADRTPIGAIMWQPHQPGRQLRSALLLPLVALFGTFILLGLRLDRRERQAAQTLLASERHATYLARHDALTGLPNRAQCSHALAAALAGLSSAPGAVFGLLVIDLDRFKQVNDTHGHGAGDELLVNVAGRLRLIGGEGSTLARIGGDEFAMVLPAATADTLALHARKVLNALAQPVDLSSARLHVGGSVGGALIDAHVSDQGEALRRADVALYCAKSAGRGQYQLFDPVMDADRAARRAIECDLRQALSDGALQLAYQPQVDAGGRLIGVEALLRWQHPQRGSIPPAEFVPIAEESGLIVPLGDYVLERALRDSLAWRGLRMAINVSAVQFRSPSFVDGVVGALARSGADPQAIDLEITENVLLEQDDHTLHVLGELRRLGLGVALDDFGTGYSSLSYLRQYPVDAVKIDRAFVHQLGKDRRADHVTTAIVQLAQALDLSVIAEGVETPLQREVLLRAGCRQFQGFLFHPPMSAPDVETLLACAAPVVGINSGAPATSGR